MEHASADQLARQHAALKKARQQIQSLSAQLHQPVAIVGLGCSLPGAASPEQLWQLLLAGGEAIRDVPPERWDIDAYYAPEPATPGKTYARSAGYLSDIDRFDARFFAVSPREAQQMDPQQRLLLEVSYHALEHAQIPADSLHGEPVGVFVGISSGEYAVLSFASEASPDAYAVTGTAMNAAAGRLAYFYGFNGPAMAIDTACSSSLVAVQQACRSLIAGECHTALAAGVQCLLTPQPHVALAQNKVLSPSGRCSPFSAQADGLVRGEGCGVLVLKRLADALAEGCQVLAVIRAGHVNQDGASSGLTVPNGLAQQALIGHALSRAKLSAADIHYVEAHGTGTALGDPIELRALDQSLCRGTLRTTPLLVGSIKANIGHLEAASGIAGVIKVVLALQHRLLPAQINAGVPTPHLDWSATPLRIVREHTPIDYAADRPFHAGVSSFGFSGTNAHLILQDPLSAGAPAAAGDATADTHTAQLLAVSAKDPAALDALLAQYRSALAARPDWRALCDAANLGRVHYAYRRAFVAQDLPALLAQLAQAQGQAVAADAPEPAAQVWLFDGDGSHYPGMARALFAADAQFRALMHAADAALRPHLGVSVVALMLDEQETGLAPQHVQPAIFCLQYALSQFLTRLNLQPQFVLGHGSGEYAAAALAGVFSLDDAARMVACRARLLQEQGEDGGMLALFADASQCHTLIDAVSPALAIAAFNGPLHHVVSGPAAALESLRTRAAAVGVVAQPLAPRQVLHSPLLQALLPAFRQVVQQTTFRPPRITFVSSMLGRVADVEVADPEYWVTQIVAAVQFEPALRALLAPHERDARTPGQWVEIGPGAALSALVPANAGAPPPLPLLPTADALTGFAQALKSLYEAGAALRWPRAPLQAGTADVLPRYPFQRQRFWLPAPPEAAAVAAAEVYRVEWRELPHAAAARRPGTRTLLVSPGGALHDGVSQCLIQAGARLQHLPIADLLQAVAQQATPTPAEGIECIVFLAAGLPADAAPAALPALALLRLVQQHYDALAGGRLRLYCVVACSANGVVLRDAALAGLCRSIWREDAAVRLDLIGLDVHAEAGASAACLVGELGTGDVGEEREILFVGGRRCVPRLVEHRLLPVPAASPVRPDRAYLVSGGSGALGSQFARALIDLGARDLILVSRHVAADASPALVEHAHRAGARLTWHAADLAEAAQLRALLRRIDTEHRPLGGIVHAAGQLADAGLNRLDAAHFQRVFAPKVDAAQALDRLTRAQPLDFFVVLSSVAAVLGAAGQANYAAANACLDALMAERQAQGLPGLSLNLGPVAGAGMAAARAATAGRSGGLIAMSPDWLRQQLGIWLAQPQAQLLVARFDWAQLRARRTADDLPLLQDFLPAAPRRAPAPAQPDGVQPAHPLADMAILVRRAIVAVLGPLDPASIRDSDTLMDLGMDSITLVELRQVLARALDRALSTHLLFDFPQVGKLVRHLAEQAASAAADSRAAVGSERPAADGVAIVGLACRFPGGIDSPERFWSALTESRELIGEIDALRWDARRCRDDGAVSTRYAGILDGIDRFDAELFGITPREARCMDPQQRLLLEVAWEALERAGYDFSRQAVAGGVFVGPGPNEYVRRFERDADALSHHMSTGNALSVTAGRLAFLLDWQGPALVVDTACSSSLMAVHLAVTALQRGECAIALAGGVNLLLSPETSLLLSKGGMLAADGRCKSFDAAADGYVRSEGCGIVVLKRLQDAVTDADEILAVIRGSAANQDGHSQGLTAPNGQAQQRVIRAALAAAGVSPREVGLVEAHGTGTALGDPVEMAALRAVYAADERDTPLWVSSVKTNLGHAEAAAGIAGLIKAVLCLQHGAIVPHRHFHALNPEIDLGAADIRIPQQLLPWRDAPNRHAGVSSFGFSGTNVHVVLQASATPPVTNAAAPRPLPGVRISAANEAALRAYLQAYRAVAAQIDASAYADLCTGSWRRAELSCCVVLDATTPAGLVAQIDELSGRADLGDAYRRTTAAPVPQSAPFRRGLVPVYPFTRSRYWLDAPAPPRARSPGLRLGARQAERVVYAVDYAGEPPYPLHDHLVHGAAAVPAAAHIALIVRMLRDLGHVQALELGDVLCENVLIAVPDMAAVRYEFVRLPALQVAAGTTVYEVQVLSDGDGQEKRHLRARASAHGTLAAAAVAPATAPLARIAGGVFYDRLYDPEIVLGQSFRRIVGIEQHVGLAVSELDWETRRDALFTPGELDSALQSIALATLSEQASRSHMHGATIPFAIDRVVVDPQRLAASAAPASRRVVCHARLVHEHPSHTTFVHDLAIAEPGQAPFLSVEGLVTRQIGASQIKPVVLPSTRYLCERWREQPLPPADLGETLDGQRFVLLHADDSDTCRLLQSVLREAGAQLVLADDLAALAAGDPWPQPWRILYWLKEDPLPADAAAFWQQQAHRLVGALKQFLDRKDGSAERSSAPLSFQLVSVRAACVEGEDGGSLFLGWVQGLCKSLHLELASDELSMLDLDASSLQQRCRALLHAVAAPISTFSAFRDGRAFALRIGEIDASQLPAAPAQGGFRCAPGAFYVVSGGLGDLALETCRWLLAQGATRLALLGRSPADGAGQQRLAELRALAPELDLDYRICDVGDFAAVAAAFAAIGAKSPIRGIFHTAGVLADSWFRQSTAAQTDALMQAKVAGSWNLHRLSREHPVDCFVLYSSLASLLGAAGQSLYAAANGFMDQLARCRRRGGLPAVAINWGPWEAIGMASRQGAAGSDAFRRLAPARAIADLAQLLAADASGLGVADVDGKALAAQWSGSDRVPPLVAEWLAARAPVAPAGTANLIEELRQTPLSARAGKLRHQLGLIVRQIMGLPPTAALAEEKPFQEFGFDSLMSIELKTQVQRRFGLQVPSTLVFDYPHLDSLARHLFDAFNRRWEPAPQAAAAPREPSTVPPPSLQLHEEMQESELALVLKNLLSAQSNGKL